MPDEPPPNATRISVRALQERAWCCSFCHRPHTEAEWTFYEGLVCICAACVDEAAALLKEKREQQQTTPRLTRVQ